MASVIILQILLSTLHPPLYNAALHLYSYVVSTKFTQPLRPLFLFSFLFFTFVPFSSFGGVGWHTISLEFTKYYRILIYCLLMEFFYLEVLWNHITRYQCGTLIQNQIYHHGAFFVTILNSIRIHLYLIELNGIWKKKYIYVHIKVNIPDI